MKIIKNVKRIDFDAIFNFATDKYGISWNDCNDIFFGNAFEYQAVTNYYRDDWKSYCSFYENIKNKASDYTVEEISKMNNYDKSYVITSAFLEENDILKNDLIQIDAR